MIDSSAAPPTIIDTYTAGSAPYDCCLVENDTILLVTNSGDDTVSVLDASSGAVITTPLNTGANPRGLATSEAYTVVCNYDSGTVSIIENANMVPDPPQVLVGSNPVAAAIDEKTSFAYVTNYGSDTVSVVNLKTQVVSDTIDVGNTVIVSVGDTGPYGIILSPDGYDLYMTCKTASRLAIISLTDLSVSTYFTVGTGPVDLTILSK